MKAKDFRSQKALSDPRTGDAKCQGVMSRSLAGRTSGTDRVPWLQVYPRPARQWQVTPAVPWRMGDSRGARSTRSGPGGDNSRLQGVGTSHCFPGPQFPPLSGAGASGPSEAECSAASWADSGNTNAMTRTTFSPKPIAGQESWR